MLKKDGLLILSTPNQETLPFTAEEFPQHKRHYTPKELQALLTSKGFEVVKRYTQYSKKRETVSEGWSGLYNIAVASKA